MLFPGQGAQELGMGRDLVASSGAARELFARADDALGYALSRLCLEGPIEDLTRTDRAQVAIYVTSAAAVLAAEESGALKRSAIVATAGLSLGEYTALWFADVFSFEDGLELVRVRGEAMQAASRAVKSGMVALLGADAAGATAIAADARGDGVLVVANLNAPGQVVLSGDWEACGRVPDAALAHGIRRALPLNVAGAFHSPLMEPARERLDQALLETTFRDPSIPVVSNVTAGPVTTAAEARKLLSEQLVRPVLWEASMRRILADGCARFIEAPPGRTLAGMLRKIAPEATVTPLAGRAGGQE
jgi:[acyl-carrier-protein] S-malonyltransferase